MSFFVFSLANHIINIHHRLSVWPLNFETNKVICKLTLSFTPYPLFQWYPQSNEILLNLSMYEMPETQYLMPQGLRLIILVV
jgi:hypothetical protein